MMYQVSDEAILNCTQHQMRPVRRIDGSGYEKVYMQCSVCGHSGGAQSKSKYDLAALPWWDEEIIARREAAREAFRLQKQAEFESRTGEWWDRYNAYLQTPHWMGVRRLVIERDGCRCQNCFRAVREETAHVHHISYAGFNHLGYSFAFECVTLCRKCHDDCHVLRRPR